jgi:dynactin 6
MVIVVFKGKTRTRDIVYSMCSAYVTTTTPNGFAKMSRRPAATKSSTKDKQPPSTFDKTATIADTTSLSGVHMLNIGASTVIHPRTTILTHSAPVRIGAHCLISDLSTIGITTPTHNPQNKRHSHAVIIEDYVIIEPGCIVEGCVGEGSILEAGAKIKRGAVVGRFCRVPPLGVVEEGEVVEDDQVALGFPLGRRVEGITDKGRELRVLVGGMRGVCEAALLVKSGRVAKIEGSKAS